jgi:hypothetical protein
MRFLNLLRRNKKPHEYAALAKASADLGVRAYSSAIEALRREDKEGDLAVPMIAVFCRWFVADQAAAFQGLAQTISCTGGALQEQLGEAFQELALRWHKQDPEAAKEAVRKAMVYAGRDRTSLRIEVANSLIPSSGRGSLGVDLKQIPDSVLDDVARTRPLYKMAEATLKVLETPAHSVHPEAMTVDRFILKHGCGTN